MGLVVEPARDAGSLDPDNPVPNSERGVLLLWNAPARPCPAAYRLTDYVIASPREGRQLLHMGNDWDDGLPLEIDESATS